MSDNKAVVLSSEKKTTKFQKGQSGNPAGRPKGIKNQITLVKLALEGELRARMRGEMGDILEAGIAMAKAGDKDMIKYFLDKCVTPAKAATDEETPRERVQILIGRLPTEQTVEGRVIEHDSNQGTD